MSLSADEVIGSLDNYLSENGVPKRFSRPSFCNFRENVSEFLATLKFNVPDTHLAAAVHYYRDISSAKKDDLKRRIWMLAYFSARHASNVSTSWSSGVQALISGIGRGDSEHYWDNYVHPFDWYSYYK